MVTIIANQKRTIAGDGGDIPCSFDLLDSGSVGSSPIEWLRDITIFGGRYRTVCVANWARINIYTKGTSPWDLGTLTIGSNVYTIPVNSGAVAGTGYDRVFYSGWVDTSFNLIRVSIPVWALEIFHARLEFQATTDYITTRASPHSVYTIPDNLDPGIFYEELIIMPNGTYDITHDFTVSAEGRVSHSTSYS